AADQFLLEHPARHVGERRTIDSRHLDECGLTHTLVVFECGEHRELLLGEFVCAGFARVQIAIVLLTASNEMRRSFCQFEPPVRPARTLQCHITTPSRRTFEPTHSRARFVFYPSMM